MGADHGPSLTEAGPDPVFEPRERELRGGQRGTVAHPGGHPEPAERRLALLRPQAAEQVNRGTAAMALDRSM